MCKGAIKEWEKEWVGEEGSYVLLVTQRERNVLSRLYYTCVFFFLLLLVVLLFAP